jgi:hypothetical protein
MVPRGMRFAGLFALAAFYVTPALGDGLSESFQRRVHELMGWIAANSGYSVQPFQTPSFAFLSPDALRHTFSSGSSLGYSSETNSIRAAQVRGTIYLPSTFVLGRDDYILLHELVHYLQDESGKSFDCLATREREAYALQSRFVEETGIGEKPNDMFMLLLRCDVR